MPIGTHRQGDSVAAHSHIRIVPRDDSEFAEDSSYHEDDTPMFRSTSLQFPFSSDDTFSSAPSTTDGPVKTTYAGIMRRFNKKDVSDGEDRPIASPISLAGLVKLQPTRKKARGSWRPIQLSDFGENDNNHDGDDLEHGVPSSPLEDFTGQSQFEHGTYNSGSESNNGCTPSRLRASPFDLPQLKTSMSTSLASPHMHDATNYIPSAISRTDSDDTSPTNTRDAVVDNYARVFGQRLPDPIILSEEMGRFNGQVTFIGHPNRDVSAHQWSAEFFRWLNIGLYSQIRRKIEGSLAADRLRASTIPHNTIEYFKAVAEQRQDAVLAGAPTQPEVGNQSETPGAPPTEAMHCPSPDDQALDASNSGSAVSRLHLPSGGTTREAAPVTTQTLDDPFVTPSRKQQPAMPNAINLTQRNSLASVGSMDFDYQFPARGAAHSHLSYDSQKAQPQKQFFIQREKERLDSMRRGLSSFNRHKSMLPESQFETKTVNEFQTPGRQSAWSRPTVSGSPELHFDPQKLKDRLEELEEPRKHISQLPRQHVSIPEISSVPAFPKALAGPPGLTVANPNRVVSTLNANAEPYVRASTHDRLFDEAESNATAIVNPQPMTNLKLSDPDGGHYPQSQEIANGLRHQLPTQQVLKGPFFTNDMPTAQNPAVSLAFHMEETARLEEWFHSGERSARQQEYAKSIMATADTDAKSRNAYNLGPIGDSKVRDPSRYEHTPAFVRLYENLLQYVEESQSGESKDPFTRDWNAPMLHLREVSPDGNNSFFDYGLGRSSPLQPRSTNRNQLPFVSNNWDGFGLFGSLAQNTNRAGVARGGLSGLNANRH